MSSGASSGPNPDNPARFPRSGRQLSVIQGLARTTLLLVCVLAWAAPAAPDLDTTLKAIENRYNHAQTLRLDFSESYIASRRPSQIESGVLYLKKPGRMRWEYSTPAGKLFLADGKDTYLYTAGDRRAEKAALKASADERAPLAFLLGRLDFHKDFQSFETHNEPNGETWIAAIPKSANLPYTRVEFQADPTGKIQKVRVTNQDQSKLEFRFSNEELNATVAPALFVFHAPPGVEVIPVEAPEAGH